MSKERLENIREIDQEISNGFAIEDLDLNTMTVLNREHFEWLKEQAERVQELEKIIEQDNRQEVLEELYEQNKRYREAIEKGINATRYTNPEVAYILSESLEGEE